MVGLGILQKYNLSLRLVNVSVFISPIINDLDQSFSPVYNPMNFLKKTLGRQDVKRDQNKIPVSFTRKHQTVEVWNNNIDQLIEKKALRKQQTSLDKSVHRIIQQKIKLPRALNQEEYQTAINMFVEVYRRHDKVPRTQKGNAKWQVCGDLMKRLRHKTQDAKMSKFVHELEIQMMINEKDEKRRKVEEFDTMVSFKNFKPKAEQKQEPKDTKSLKFTAKEKEEKKNSNLNRSHSRSKKSLKSAKNLSSSSLKRQTLSRKRSEGDLQFSKLQNLLKDVSTKVVRGNIQYDYSSILEGSKSNIQRRNNNRNRTQKEEPKAIEKKVKKNEAFVFYRPGRE